MLSLNKSHENLAGKLLLSSALVAVSLTYGWWQRHGQPRLSLAMAPIPVPPPQKKLTSVSKSLTATGLAVPAAPTKPMTPDAAALGNARAASVPAQIAPHARKSVSVAIAAPPKHPSAVRSAMPVASAQQNDLSPASTPPAPLTSQVALAMDLPTEEGSPPLPLVTGTPPLGVTPTIPARTYLKDGDYLSDKHQFEWGDLRVKISIHGGQITGVQILQYPDHRSQSLYLSQMAGPLLESEVIKTQKAEVDAVSSATDTSYGFQDAVANAIMKATRG